MNDLHLNSLDKLQASGFQIEFHSHSKAILNIDYPTALRELDQVLGALNIPIASLVRGGGGETEVTQGLRRQLASLGWRRHSFEIKKLIDGVERESISHQVDHVRTIGNGKLAMEIEWNNKDPFFDRDLENFKRLHAEAAISVGVIITRGRGPQDNIRNHILRFATERKILSYVDLQSYGIQPTVRQRSAVEGRIRSGNSTFSQAWADVFCSDKYGQATTHWRKLQDRVHRGVGNPCPLLLIGIPDSVIRF